MNYYDMVPIDADYVQITRDCHIRVGPFKVCDSLAIAHKGERLPFAGLVNENGWLEVEYENDKFGWVSGTCGRLV